MLPSSLRSGGCLALLPAVRCRQASCSSARLPGPKVGLCGTLGCSCVGADAVVARGRLDAIHAWPGVDDQVDCFFFNVPEWSLVGAGAGAVCYLSGALFGMGARVVCSVNTPEWSLVDAACHAYSMVTVPLYDTLGPDTVKYICNHAELAAVACSLGEQRGCRAGARSGLGWGGW